MDRIRQLQASRNAETRDGWNRFSAHRQRVTHLLLEAQGDTNGTLCVLGAGNCNDLDLDRLSEAFVHVDLVDIDDESIRAGMARQGVTASHVAACGGVDVTGVAISLSEWSPQLAATDEQVDACLASVEQFKPALAAAGYSIVASVCLLSQLVESITQTLGANHPRFLDVLTCIRRAHLRQLIELAVPGGTVILITDVVSSLTVPTLVSASDTELPTLVGRAIAARNFFTGVNPFVLKQLLETDGLLAERLTDVRLSNPWVWDLGPRLYAVCALTAKRV